MDLLAFIAATFGLLILPGPTNLLLTASGASAGVLRSLPLIAASIAGYLVSIVSLREVAGPILAALPILEMSMRVAIALYLLHLSLTFWKSGRAERETKQSVSFGQVFLTTCLNPKAFIFAFAILPQRTDLIGLLPWLLAFGMMATLTGSLWIAAGATARARLSHLISSSVGYRLSAVGLVVMACVIGAQAIRF